MNLEEIKQRLESEKEELLKEIQKISIDGDAKETNSNPDDVADQVDLADEMENLNTNASILEVLRARLEEIDNALVKINTGVYGKCVICGEKIEKDRLMSNLTATTCKKHMNEYQK